MKPVDLVDVAKTLCPAGPGRPTHAFLRRSISTSYYAAFTALSIEASRPYSGDVRLAAMRLIEHGAARDVFNTIKQSGVVPWLGGRPQCDAVLKQFAEDFEALQLVRHRADYDHTFSPTKADALTAIDRAERAILQLKEARNNCPDQLQVVCIAAFANSTLRKRMKR